MWVLIARKLGGEATEEGLKELIEPFMFTNYFKIAWRNLLKNKAFSFANITGLALSMAVCLLLIMIIKDANEYDKFHPDRERVYRINTEELRKDGSSEPYATSPYIAWGNPCFQLYRYRSMDNVQQQTIQRYYRK